MTIGLLVALTIAGGCTAPPPDADVIVIGAGIAGLAAAIEASDAGARVIVLDANSVGGGHAVKAGGFALVGTPLQERRGYDDSPAIAARDLLAWGEDSDPDWVHRYVRDSRTEVHDWLTDLGVNFSFILDTPQHSVPRFHFAGGPASRVVIPMMWAASAQPRIAFRWNSEAVRIVTGDGRVAGVEARNLRTGTKTTLRARAVVIATGGFESDLAQVRAAWPADVPVPDRLYVGAGQFATGAGIGLGRAAGAALLRLDRQAIFAGGLPDPKFPDSGRALLTQNPRAIWVNAAGERFVNERAPSRITDAAVLAQSPAMHWLIYDSRGAGALRVRDAVWLADPDAQATLTASPYFHRADSVAELARAAGLPPAALADTLSRWNELIAAGTDTDHGRFTRERPDPDAAAIGEPPFYAVQLFPLTRKSMGGLAVSERTEVLTADGKAIPGLYAAGEVTGVAGINGRHGGEGTFLGPAVYMGRISGREAAAQAMADASRAATGGRPPAPPMPAQAEPRGEPEQAVTMGRTELEDLLGADRPGYWHFREVHRTVLARELDCARCHTPTWPTKAANSPDEWRTQLLSCSTCH